MVFDFQFLDNQPFVVEQINVARVVGLSEIQVAQFTFHGLVVARLLAFFGEVQGDVFQELAVCIEQGIPVSCGVADDGFAVVENDELLSQSVGAVHYGVVIGVKNFVPVVSRSVGFVGDKFNHLCINLMASRNG